MITQQYGEEVPSGLQWAARMSEEGAGDFPRVLASGLGIETMSTGRGRMDVGRVGLGPRP